MVYAHGKVLFERTNSGCERRQASNADVRQQVRESRQKNGPFKQFEELRDVSALTSIT